MTTPKNRPGRADHAKPATGLLANLPFRTALQGLGTDVAVAAGLILYEALENGNADWRLLGISLAKTTVMTVISYGMKKLKPPA